MKVSKFILCLFSFLVSVNVGTVNADKPLISSLRHYYDDGKYVNVISEGTKFLNDVDGVDVVQLEGIYQSGALFSPDIFFLSLFPAGWFMWPVTIEGL
ncbi:hypothetical protein [Maridesulfovibrio bastinii]|uniref:hypothetical protein n=1 Tax=Maridesulfovibrio bastinii TaxID=47157 RepID=UPI000486F99B|nr:hypothetical protein [Maridesulfovibrio bastinii]